MSAKRKRGTIERAPRRRFYFPLGLLVVLVTYALAVVAYLDATYWSTNEYKASEHYVQALALLGDDDGRTCATAQLQQALEHLIEAAALVPEAGFLAEHIERLRWRYSERNVEMPLDLVRRAEAVSASARRVREERTPFLVVGIRDRGWAPDQVLEGPKRALRWAIPGAVLILLVWGYLQFNARSVWEEERGQHIDRTNEEVRRLGESRKERKG